MICRRSNSSIRRLISLFCGSLTVFFLVAVMAAPLLVNAGSGSLRVRKVVKNAAPRILNATAPLLLFANNNNTTATLDTAPPPPCDGPAGCPPPPPCDGPGPHGPLHRHGCPPPPPPPPPCDGPGPLQPAGCPPAVSHDNATVSTAATADSSHTTMSPTAIIGAASLGGIAAILGVLGLSLKGKRETVTKESKNISIGENGEVEVRA
mmetsp:Transcript_6164/g.8997  ORF Transcript_6164/g.8997 Transcript_6164/m.8997 type:complete len:207 (+) Transcript_6164:102-722(+)